MSETCCAIECPTCRHVEGEEEGAMVDRKRCLYCVEHSAFAECRKWKVAPNGVMWDATRGPPYYWPWFRPHSDFCCNEFRDVIDAKDSEEKSVPREPEAVKWEYKTSLVSVYTIRTGARLDPALNAQGRDGWELVQLIPTELEGEGYHRAIFKRRRRAEPGQGKCCECENQGKEGVQ